MKHPESPSKPPPMMRRAVAVVCAIALLAALAFLGWFWGAWRRPGMRHYLQGMTLLSHGNSRAAEQEWIDGVEQDPNDYHCYAELGDYYAQLRLYDNAAACYHAACDHRPRDGNLRLRWAEAEQKSGHLDLAATAASQAYRLLPNDAKAAGLYGLIETEAKRPNLAVPALRRAYQLRPTDLLLFHKLISDEMDVLDFRAAEADLAPYLRMHPVDAQACLWMAQIDSHKPLTRANLSEGIKFARRALTGLPTSIPACTTLGELYLNANQPADALAAYQAGQKIDPNSEAILRGLSNCYVRMGKTADLARVSAHFQRVLTRHDRITTLQRMLDADPHDIPHALELARLVNEDGRYALARDYYARLAHAAPNDPRVRRALTTFYSQFDSANPAGALQGSALAPISKNKSAPLSIPNPTP
ncbi:MAG TPA: tetratricopeptide repeat protein [Armatimonadota bacterium]|nr:tetratricopeptide repeat protein [Armatimonadota bacterium]